MISTLNGFMFQLFIVHVVLPTPLAIPERKICADARPDCPGILEKEQSACLDYPDFAWHLCPQSCGVCHDGQGKRKRKGSDSVLWQKPLQPHENPKKQRDNTKTPPKTSITQRLRTHLGRSVWVMTVTRLVWFNRSTGSQLSTLHLTIQNSKTF